MSDRFKSGVCMCINPDQDRTHSRECARTRALSVLRYSNQCGSQRRSRCNNICSATSKIRAPQKHKNNGNRRCQEHGCDAGIVNRLDQIIEPTCSSFIVLTILLTVPIKLRCQSGVRTPSCAFLNQRNYMPSVSGVSDQAIQFVGKHRSNLLGDECL